MFALILLVIFGFLTAYFATQNVSPATITYAGYTFRNIPMYVIVIGSMLLGIFISWLIDIVNSISSTLTIHGKDSAIADAQKQIEALRQENRDLELEVARLKGEQNEPVVVEKHTENMQEESRPSFFHRLRHSFG